MTTSSGSVGSCANRRRSRAGRRWEQDASGATMVEFALILPILLLLVVGIIQFGIAYNVQISLTGAAREGARVMAIQNDSGAATAATVTAAALNPAPAVSVSPDPCQRGEEVTVTASRSVQISVPFFGNPTVDLEGVGVMRCGG
jgi:Flp pilus assembly protein TadG